MGIKSFMRLVTKSPNCDLVRVTKEKEVHRLARTNCAAILVGVEGEEGKRYNVPVKFLRSILPEFIEEDQTDPKMDVGPVRIHCTTESFDHKLEALALQV
ncbi:hypothetical protein M5689_007982 [Euphorbia peplus]|nr:hypothetical protein M5689_007982 [Euphorbia peplus]